MQSPFLLPQMRGHARWTGRMRNIAVYRKPCGNGGGGIRIVSQPVPLVFCFETAGHLMDAAARAVCTLHVLSSAVMRVGRRFFLSVTVRLSERIEARCLFSEYGRYIGAGWCLAAYAAEQADRCIPNAVERIGETIRKR